MSPTRTLTLDLYGRQLQALADTAAAWQPRPREAALAREVAELVRFCLFWPDRMTRFVAGALENVTSGRVEDVEGTRLAVDSLLARAIELLRGIGEWGQDFERRGYPVEGVAELAEAVAQLRRLKRETFFRWPFDPKHVDEARAALARGEDADPAEAFADIAGVNKDEWLQIVEAHKASRE